MQLSPHPSTRACHAEMLFCIGRSPPAVCQGAQLQAQSVAGGVQSQHAVCRARSPCLISRTEAMCLHLPGAGPAARVRPTQAGRNAAPPARQLQVGGEGCFTPALRCSLEPKDGSGAGSRHCSVTCTSKHHLGTRRSSVGHRPRVPAVGKKSLLVVSCIARGTIGSALPSISPSSESWPGEQDSSDHFKTTPSQKRGPRGSRLLGTRAKSVL